MWFVEDDFQWGEVNPGDEIPRVSREGNQVGLSHCRHEGLMTVWDEARLRRGHNEQSHRGHQCIETMLTGESLFHISTPLGI